MKKYFLSIAIVFVFASFSFAQSISQKQNNQKERIENGVKSGELTRAETRHLVLDQKEIQTMKKVAKADGKVTRRERKIIKREQRQASRKIYRQKHDGQDRSRN